MKILKPVRPLESDRAFTLELSFLLMIGLVSETIVRASDCFALLCWKEDGIGLARGLGVLIHVLCVAGELSYFCSLFRCHSGKRELKMSSQTVVCLLPRDTLTASDNASP